VARVETDGEPLRTELALEIAERPLGQLVDVVPVPVWIFALDGRVRYGNHAWVRAASGIGGAGAEATWADACHPDDRSTALAAFRGAAARAANFAIEVRLRESTGACRWWSFAGGPYFGSDGNLESYVGTCTDVTATREAQRSVRKLAAKLIAAQETERRRIARELHDDVMQRLFLLTAKLENMMRISQATIGQLRADVVDARRQAQRIATTIHVLSHQLHPAKLDLLGLVTTLDSLCRDFSRDHNVRITFKAEGALSNLPPDTALCLFRIAQEALQNAVKHSDARAIRVHASGDSAQVGLQVTDNGKGFDPFLQRSGLGLLTMRERVELIGGALRIDSRTKKGTTIEAIVPLAVDVAAQ
jgi:PAS domain S-box-containing protein